MSIKPPQPPVILGILVRLVQSAMQGYIFGRLIIQFHKKNPAYGRHQISQPMRIIGPIQFWRVCVIYLEKKKKKKNWGG